MSSAPQSADDLPVSCLYRFFGLSRLSELFCLPRLFSFSGFTLENPLGTLSKRRET
jgi:hypothetical protein